MVKYALPPRGYQPPQWEKIDPKVRTVHSLDARLVDCFGLALARHHSFNVLRLVKKIKVKKKGKDPRHKNTKRRRGFGNRKKSKKSKPDGNRASSRHDSSTTPGGGKHSHFSSQHGGGGHGGDGSHHSCNDDDGKHDDSQESSDGSSQDEDGDFEDTGFSAPAFGFSLAPTQMRGGEILKLVKTGERLTLQQIDSVGRLIFKEGSSVLQGKDGASLVDEWGYQVGVVSHDKFSGGADMVQWFAKDLTSPEFRQSLQFERGQKWSNLMMNRNGKSDRQSLLARSCHSSGESIGGWDSGAGATSTSSFDESTHSISTSGFDESSSFSSLECSNIPFGHHLGFVHVGSVLRLKGQGPPLVCKRIEADNRILLNVGDDELEGKSGASLLDEQGFQVAVVTKDKGGKEYARAILPAPARGTNAFEIDNEPVPQRQQQHEQPQRFETESVTCVSDVPSTSLGSVDTPVSVNKLGQLAVQHIKTTNFTTEDQFDPRRPRMNLPEGKWRDLVLEATGVSQETMNRGGRGIPCTFKSSSPSSTTSSAPLASGPTPPEKPILYSEKTDAFAGLAGVSPRTFRATADKLQSHKLAMRNLIAEPDGQHPAAHDDSPSPFLVSLCLSDGDLYCHLVFFLCLWRVCSVLACVCVCVCACTCVRYASPCDDVHA